MTEITSTCDICGLPILWMYGGMFWLHRSQSRARGRIGPDHLAPNPAPKGYVLRDDYRP